MKEAIIAERYAEAFVDYAEPSIGIPRIVIEMKMLHGLLREHRDFEHFLEAPEVPGREKFAVIDRVMAGGFSVQLTNFLKYLIKKNRIDKIHLIADYVRLTYAHGDVTDAILRTTFPVDLDTVQTIKTKLEKLYGKKVNLYLELDPDLLGGVQVVVGNQVIDGSIRNRLQELRKQLLKTQVVR